jgi:hypothetical protein
MSIKDKLAVHELPPVEVTAKWLLKMFEGMECCPGFVLNVVTFDHNGLPEHFSTVGKNISADRRTFYSDAMYLASQTDSEKQKVHLASMPKANLPQTKKSARILEFGTKANNSEEA